MQSLPLINKICPWFDLGGVDYNEWRKSSPYLKGNVYQLNTIFTNFMKFAKL